MKYLVFTLVLALALGTMALNAYAFTDGPPSSWDDKTGGDWTSYDKARHLKNDADTEYEFMQTIYGPECGFRSTQKVCVDRKSIMRNPITSNESFTSAIQSPLAI